MDNNSKTIGLSDVTQHKCASCDPNPNMQCCPKKAAPNTATLCFLPRLARSARRTRNPRAAPPWQPFTPDDHSKVVPLLPIPNRTVKRLRADDSGRTSVKVGHRQALIPKTPLSSLSGVLLLRGANVGRQPASLKRRSLKRRSLTTGGKTTGNDNGLHGLHGRQRLRPIACTLFDWANEQATMRAWPSRPSLLLHPKHHANHVHK
jgi:hypothetical protein